MIFSPKYSHFFFRLQPYLYRRLSRTHRKLVQWSIIHDRNMSETCLMYNFLILSVSYSLFSSLLPHSVSAPHLTPPLIPSSVFYAMFFFSYPLLSVTLFFPLFCLTVSASHLTPFGVMSFFPISLFLSLLYSTSFTLLSLFLMPQVLFSSISFFFLTILFLTMFALFRISEIFFFIYTFFLNIFF